MKDVRLWEFGVFMVKSLLILALVTTQLLAGSGGSLYLCISNDGSHWCVDSDPASCTCCRQEAEKTAESGEGDDSGCCCSHVAGSCDGDRDEHRKPSELPELAGQPCGCTHILISHPQQSPTAVRASSTTDAERLALLVALLPHALLHDQFVSDGPDPAFRLDSPPLPSQSLTILSSVVLRC